MQRPIEMRRRFGNFEVPPLHVMGHCRFDHWPSSMNQAWEIFQEVIDDIQHDTNLRTHAFVLMGNHYHWLCSHGLTRDPDIFNWFHEVLNCQFLKYISPGAGELYTMEKAPKIIRTKSFPQYKATYRYVYNNPVSAGLVYCPLNYPYSTLSYALGKTGLGFELIDNMGLIFSPSVILNWLSGRERFWAH